MGKLEGKVALVTGSGRNIGRATVLKLAGEGAHVVVNARTNQAEADAVVREAQALGVKALAVIADIAKKDQVEAMAARALSEFGRVDILINNAAIRPHKPFTELTAQDWEAVRGVVLDGALYLTRARHRVDGQEPLWPHPVLYRRRRLRRRQRTRPCLRRQNGPGRDLRAAWPRSSPRTTSGSTWCRRAASIPGGQIPNGIRAGCRTPPAFRWDGRERWTRSPPPVCFWSVTTADLSPVRRSTSMAAAGTY